ncbi:MAG: hypothetical protein NT082_05140 [Chloroflexi bacterium]|nr:hypothetical protein [Chloroflexota bacterium]
MEWKTRATELLGCKYPILQGAAERIGNWKFAAAVAEAGAHGYAGRKSPFQAELPLCQILRDYTGGSREQPGLW